MSQPSIVPAPAEIVQIAPDVVLDEFYMTIDSSHESTPIYDQLVEEMGEPGHFELPKKPAKKNKMTKSKLKKMSRVEIEDWIMRQPVQMAGSLPQSKANLLQVAFSLLEE